MKGMLQDLRYAARVLAKYPGYTALAVLLLAIGIGVNTTVFSVMDCLFLRPMSIEKPEEVVRFHVKRQEQYQSFSYTEFEEIRRQSASYSDILASSRRGAILTREGGKEMVRADIVSDNYFSVLGIRPLIGQGFTVEGQGLAGDTPEIVISHGLWQRGFGADPEIVGKTIIVNGENSVVRGVIPPTFGGLQRGMLITDLWLPAAQWPSYGNLQNREYRDFDLLGRLNPDTTVEVASSELKTIEHRLALAYPESIGGATYFLEALEPSASQSITSGAIILAGPFLILIICCANVAGMSLAKTEERRSEIAVRLSLGAGRRRLLRQLYTESLLLALPGTVLGLLITYWLINLQSAFLPPYQMIMRFDLRIDIRVLAFAVGASIAAVIFSGFTPALRALKTELSSLLKGAPAKAESRKYGLVLRNILVSGQIALSLTLFIAGGLFLKSLLLSERIDPGFDTKKKLLVITTAPSMRTSESNQRLFIPAVERIAALPGVKGATYAARMLLSGSGGGASCDISIPGVENPAAHKGFIIKRNSVGWNYFRTLGTNIIRGRGFAAEDELSGRRTVIINETFAGRFWPDTDPIDRYISVMGNNYQIVGIVQEGRINQIHESPEPYVYFPFSQLPVSNVSIVVETEGDPLDMAATVKREIQSVDKSVTFLQTETLKDIMGQALHSDRIAALGSGVVGILAILLTAVGLYGILAYIARRRVHEIGIRIALGAQTGDISRLVIGNGFRITGIGIAIGMLISFFAMRLIAGMIYGVAPTDIWIFLSGVIAVSAISLTASYIPARRASKIDSIQALRYE